QICARVIAARAIQQRRYMELERFYTGLERPVAGVENEPIIYCNAQMSSRMLKLFCRIDAAGESLLRMAMEKLSLSARAHDHILKVGRTIADLAGSEDIRPEHLAEAIQYRNLDREAWGK